MSFLEKTIIKYRKSFYTHIYIYISCSQLKSNARFINSPTVLPAGQTAGVQQHRRLAFSLLSSLFHFV